MRVVVRVRVRVPRDRIAHAQAHAHEHDHDYAHDHDHDHDHDHELDQIAASLANAARSLSPSEPRIDSAIAVTVTVASFTSALPLRVSTA